MTRSARQKRIRRERQERLAHCPSGKIPFNTKEGADLYMSASKLPLRRSYRCEHCRDWHLTSKP